MLGINKLLAFLRRSVGLRTDAASATGSLHAKTKDVKDSITAQIGTSAHTRANNTVMGWLNSPIKNIQTGVTAFDGSGGGSNTKDVAISSVTTSKCIVLSSLRSTSTGADAATLGHLALMTHYASLTSSTNLRLIRGGAAASTFDVAWQVIQFY